MDSFTKKEQIVILILVLVVILSLGVRFGLSKNSKPEDEIELDEESQVLEDFEATENSIDEKVEDFEANPIIMVHISAEVYNRGVYEMEIGDRVNDVVNLAGGLTKSADVDRINLAKKIFDEEKVHIPKIGEEISDGNTSDISNFSSSSVNESSYNTTNNKIDLNTCSKDELISLPGIGNITADKIIEYRNSNKFRNIEELKNVSGIGDKKFESVKELIKVN